jgi:hypothetical protein
MEVQHCVQNSINVDISGRALNKYYEWFQIAF